MEYIYVAHAPEGVIGASKSLKKCYDELKATSSQIPSYNTYRKNINENNEAYYYYDGIDNAFGIIKTHIL